LSTPPEFNHVQNGLKSDGIVAVAATVNTREGKYLTNNVVFAVIKPSAGVKVGAAATVRYGMRIFSELFSDVAAARLSISISTRAFLSTK
jgi:hypothetical protein